MAYTKTNWVDNVTPIDKDNLNKIEQGIYDNSTSIDTINGALAPTENGTVVVENTEFCQNNTIKSAFNEILIKGNTTQEEDPTPDNPQDINKVVGNVKININNANVFPSSIQYNGTNILVQRGTASISEDEFSFTATGNDMYFGAVPARGTTHQNTYGSLIEIPTGVTNIYLQCSNNAFSGNYCCFYDKDKVSLGYSAITTSKEVPANAKYCSFRIGVPSSVAGTTYKTKIMVSYSTINKYVRHQLQELPLTLDTLELCKIGDYQDYFYKDNGKWYKYEKIKKYQITGNEGWVLASGDVKYITSITDYETSNNTPYCTYFKGETNCSGASSMQNYDNDTIAFIQTSGSVTPRLYIKTTEMTVSELANWLRTNTPYLYYATINPTIIEITDTTLKSQLDAIRYAKSGEIQTNITTSSSEAQPIVKAEMFLNNINGKTAGSYRWCELIEERI